MVTGTISIRSVEALTPGDTLWDKGVSGFGVRRQQDRRVYVPKYRAFGIQRFLTIGPHGSPWTPETARKEARRLLGLVAADRDPADEKAQARLRERDTLGKIVEDYLAVARQRQRPRSYIETVRHLRVAWKPLHRKSVFAISRRNVSDRLREITAQGPTAAVHARAALSAMFNWAIAEGYEIVANPVTGTNRPIEAGARSRVLSDAELRAIWRACGDDDYGRIVRLLILTGQRRDEVGSMRWPEISGDVWTLPTTRTKNHREHSLPLSKAALALIEAQLRRNDRDFVFGIDARGFVAWSRSKIALDARLGNAVAPFVVHDIRRTVATGMADRLGVLPHIVEAILNHASGHRSGVAGVYNRARYAEEMRTALGRWADHVARIVSGRPTSITLHRVG
jgi:integrase